MRARLVLDALEFEDLARFEDLHALAKFVSSMRVNIKKGQKKGPVSRPFSNHRLRV